MVIRSISEKTRQIVFSGSSKLVFHRPRKAEIQLRNLALQVLSASPSSGRGAHTSVTLARPNNSFKPTPHRGVNSVLCATLHAVATPLRGGLTQALGGRKTFCHCVARKRDFLASVSAALRSGSQHVASSAKSVWRAHTSYALRSPAPEAVFGIGRHARY